MLSGIAVGQLREISATVTYVAAGNVYMNVGRNDGLRDSASAVVRRNGATVAIVRLSAASSRSSSWTGDEDIQLVRTGDSAVVRCALPVAEPVEVVDTMSRAPGPTLLKAVYRRPERPAGSSSLVDLTGRVGVQFYGLGFDEASLNMVQTGLLLSLRAQARDLPLRFDLYSNLREMARGSAGLFSARSSTTSRLYRFTLEYDDSKNIVTAGRAVPSMAPTIGILDGVMYARRWRGVTAGAGAGLQPDHDLQGTDTDRRKAILFVLVQPPEWPSASFSGAYAKTWYHGASEREALNAAAGVQITSRLSLWSSTDIDLRVTENGVHTLSPSLSLLLFTANWRVSDVASLSGGIDASRSVLPYSFARFIPDSMMDHTLRSGMTFSGSMMFGGGLSVNATISPRMTGGSYNGEYSGSTSVSAGNLLSSGVSLRVQGLLTESSMTNSQGYGLVASMNAFTVDWSARVQQIRYILKKAGTWNTGTTLGLDLMVPILRPLTLILSADAVNGYGSTSRSLFAELSYRF